MQKYFVHVENEREFLTSLPYLFLEIETEDKNFVINRMEVLRLNKYLEAKNGGAFFGYFFPYNETFYLSLLLFPVVMIKWTGMCVRAPV